MNKIFIIGTLLAASILMMAAATSRRAELDTGQVLSATNISIKRWGTEGPY